MGNIPVLIWWGCLSKPGVMSRTHIHQGKRMDRLGYPNVEHFFCCGFYGHNSTTSCSLTRIFPTYMARVNIHSIRFDKKRINTIDGIINC